MKEFNSFNLINYTNESKIPQTMTVMILSESNELVFLGTVGDAVINSHVKSTSAVAKLNNVIASDNIIKMYVSDVNA